MRRGLEPASGSVIANTILAVPLARPGSQVMRCSPVPNSAIISAEIAADTSSRSSGVPAAAISSQTIASSVRPPPPPPQAPGRRGGREHRAGYLDLGQPPPPPAVGLGDVHPDEPRLAQS